MTDEPPSPVRSSRFPTTRWSLVIQAGDGNSEAAREALARLCEEYWRPLYSFARRKGESAEDAKDTVKGFFADFLGRTHLLGHVSQDKGRFRSYLRGAFEHYRKNVQRREAAARRGAGVVELPIELDFSDGERRHRAELATDLDPEKLYEREWALTFMERVLSRLKNRYTVSGQLQVYEALVPFLPKGEAPPYETLADQLGMTINSLKVTLHRIRARFGEALREEGADVVSDPNDVEKEIRDLLAALSI